MIAPGSQDAFENGTGGIVIAAFKFERENPDELDVEEGARLRTIEKRDEWWFAETEDGSQQGIIPLSYVVSEAEYAKLNSFDVDDIDLNDLPDDDFGALPQAPTDQLMEQDQYTGETEDHSDAPPPSPSAAQAALAATYSESQDSQGLQDIIEETQAAAPPPPPPPSAAEAALQASFSAAATTTESEPDEASQAEYDELASKFEALQKRVADVKLTIDQPAPINENSSAPLPPSPAQAAAALAGSPPPPSPAQAAAALQNSASSPPPPPSPGVAAATFALQQQQQQNQQPPPPSPVEAQQAALKLERERLEAERARFEAEKRRVAQGEELSRRRAEEMRAKREQEMARRNQIQQQDNADMATYNRYAHQRTNTQQAGRAAMQNAITAVKEAVGADNARDFAKAYTCYERSLELFAQVLQSGANRPQYPVIAERMQGYLQRMSQIEPEICSGPWSDGRRRAQVSVPRYKDRVKTLLVMHKCAGFDLLSPGEELRLKARFAESSDDNRTAFRAYSEGIEYLMAHHKILKESKKTDAALMNNLTSMLAKAEELKKKL